jgi:hypothetical protein
MTKQEAINRVKAAAKGAWDWSSFRPKKREERYLIDFKNQLDDYTEEVAKVDEKAVPDFIEKFTNKNVVYLHAESRTASSAVTGPARFPVEANRKKMERAMTLLNEKLSFPKYYISKLKKRLKKESGFFTIDADLERQKKKLKALKKNHEDMKEMNKIIRSKNDVKNRLKAYGISDKTIKEITDPEYTKRLGYVNGFTFSLTNNLANIKRVEARIKQLESKTQRRDEGVKSEVSFDGGKLIRNFEENRFQFIFDGIPPVETRNLLKSNGFRWSPKQKAWQRYLNGNTLFVLKQIYKDLNIPETEFKKFTTGESDVKTSNEEQKGQKAAIKQPEKISKLAEMAATIRKFINSKWPNSSKNIKVLTHSEKNSNKSPYIAIDGGNTPVPDKIKNWFADALGSKETVKTYGIIIYHSPYLYRVLDAIKAETTTVDLFSQPAPELIKTLDSKKESFKKDAAKTATYNFKFKVGDRVYYENKKGKNDAIILSAYFENNQPVYTVYPPGKKENKSYHVWVKENELFSRAKNQKPQFKSQKPKTPSQTPEELEAEMQAQFLRAQRIHSQRPFPNQLIDNAAANHTQRLPTKKNVDVWSKNPGRSDIIGVDGPANAKPTLKRDQKIFKLLRLTK